MPSPARPNPLTGSRLDRVSARRADTAWVEALLHDPASRFTALWRGQSLIGEGPRAVLLPAPAPLAARHPWALLGLLDGQAVFVLDLGGLDAPLDGLPAGAGGFAELRASAGALDPAEASLLAHARGLMLWRARHRYCGICGAPTRPAEAGTRVVCTGCGAEHFARTDPAVIMLVTSGDRALLGHARRFSGPIYSTLAGFVEPGESLEEAVAREVREEAGIEVTDVAYHSSQPGPAPASLMLGFHARALSEDVTIDAEELTDARWFSRAELAEPSGVGIEQPGPISIARRMIDDWLHLAE